MLLKKSFKKLAPLALAVTMCLPFAQSSFAAVDDKPPQYYEDFTGYTYSIGTQSKYREETWSHTHTNPTGVTASVTYTTTRTKHSEATVSASASFGVMTKEVGVTAEVAWGTSSDVSTSVTWNIPANSSYRLSTGNEMQRTTGTERRYSNGVLVTSKAVSGNWSWAGYSTSIKL